MYVLKKTTIVIFVIMVITMAILLLLVCTKNEYGYQALMSLCTSIMSASIFYYIFEYLPENKNKKNSVKVLNQLINSIYEAFITQNHFSYIKHTKNSNISITSDKILNLINKVKNCDFKDRTDVILSFKFALETAHSKLREFENCLVLANNISPSHSLEWLSVTQELRLFAQEYERLYQFSFAKNPVDLKNLKTGKNLNEHEKYLDTLRCAFVMFMEATVEWMNQCDHF